MISLGCSSLPMIIIIIFSPHRSDQMTERSQVSTSQSSSSSIDPHSHDHQHYHHNFDHDDDDHNHHKHHDQFGLFFYTYGVYLHCGFEHSFISPHNKSVIVLIFISNVICYTNLLLLYLLLSHNKSVLV